MIPREGEQPGCGMRTCVTCVMRSARNICSFGRHDRSRGWAGWGEGAVRTASDGYIRIPAANPENAGMQAGVPMVGGRTIPGRGEIQVCWPLLPRRIFRLGGKALFRDVVER